MAYQYRFVDVLARGLENAANRAERAESARVQQQQFDQQMNLRRQEAQRTADYRESVLAGQTAAAEATAQYRQDVLGMQADEAAQGEETVIVPGSISDLFGSEGPMKVKRSDLPSYVSMANVLADLKAANDRTQASINAASSSAAKGAIAARPYASIGKDMLAMMIRDAVSASASTVGEDGSRDLPGWAQDNPERLSDVAKYINDLQAEWDLRKDEGTATQEELDEIINAPTIEQPIPDSTGASLGGALGNLTQRAVDALGGPVRGMGPAGFVTGPVRRVGY